MNKQELESLKNLVDSIEFDNNDDMEIGGCSVGECSVCCTKYNGNNL